jgi:8-oxo-dGTP pyrophosphatase MutT (NUDIX family)
METKMTDVQNADDEKIGAACVLAFNCTDDEILAVSRGADLANLGIPGGKIEQGEIPAQAAARELFEETGVVVHPNDFAEEGFVRKSRVSVAQTCIAMVCKKVKLASSSEGQVSWVCPDEVCKGSFADYNKDLLANFSKADAPKPTCGCGKSDEQS